jgi:pimeloyl-ACP methyl ester esterase
MPYITAGDNTVIHFESVGTGPPLVFIHGWSMSGSVWRLLQRKLSPGYRFITVDLRGHGGSSAAVSGYGMDDFSSDIKKLFEALELENATLVGWSLGALVSIAAGAALQERLTSLVLVSGTPKFTISEDYPCGLSSTEPRGLSLRLKRNPQKALENFFRSMFTREELADNRYDQMSEEITASGKSPGENAAILSLKTLAAADLRTLLPGIKVPVLLLHGSRDTICLPDASRYMANRIPDSTLVIVEGAGHAPMLSKPTELAQEMGRFLGRVYAEN